MSRKEKIKALETELRFLYNDLWIVGQSNTFHARHNKKFKRYADVVNELERISLKWKFKKIIRRIKKLWQK